MKAAKIKSTQMRSRLLKMKRRTSSPARAKRLGENVSARKRMSSTLTSNMSSLRLAEVEAIVAAEDAVVVIEEIPEAGGGVVVMGSEAEAMVASVADGAEVIVALSTSRTKTLFQAWAAHSWASISHIVRDRAGICGSGKQQVV